MKNSNWMGLGLIVLLALGAGWWLGRASVPSNAAVSENTTSAPKQERRVLYYRNPMGLPDTSPVPKKDSMGMDYVPVYDSEAPADSAPKQARRILYYRNPMGLPDTSPVPKKDSMGMDYMPVYDGEAPSEPGTVVLPPEKVQKLGVRTVLVTREALSAQVRASASVQVDETRQFAIAPRFEGWIERLHANQTGMAVRRGQPLMTLYSPALIAAQEEYRIADEAARRLDDHDPSGAAAMRQLRDAARVRLRNWQVAGARLGSTGDTARLAITSPADAVVIEKPVVEGDRFEAGQTVLRLADLSSVWVVADVPVSQAAELRLGHPARFETPSLPGEVREGRIEFIQPVVDPDSRTVAVRLVLPNPDGVLRPGLFGEVLLQGNTDDVATVVPRSAVIDSGTRQIVLVQVAEGRFEPRTVRLGRRAADRVAVLEGLAEGETVVVSANFLIDAESNLTSALQGLTHAHGDDARPSEPASEAERQPVAPAKSDDATAPTDPHAGHGKGH
jgi:Cu(I)/Ag(I) efflux system membrane fusion protein